MRFGIRFLSFSLSFFHLCLTSIHYEGFVAMRLENSTPEQNMIRVGLLACLLYISVSLYLSHYLFVLHKSWLV